MTDLVILKQLEKQLDTEFEKVDVSEIIGWEYYKFARYAIGPNQHIIGLCLSLFGLKKIPPQIPLLENLTALNLQSNQISDISPLQGLKQITELELRDNQIADISPLQDLGKITTLSLHNNQNGKLCSFQSVFAPWGDPREGSG